MGKLSLALIVCVAVVLMPEEYVTGLTTPSPILIIPGFMGSQLRVEDKANRRSGWWCKTRNKYKKLWITWRLLIKRGCTKAEFSLKYDADTRSFLNNTNMKIVVPGFGETSSVEYLSRNFFLSKIKLLKYFNRMVKYFVERGYKRGKTIRAAPYDWRLAADELEKRGYYHRLRSLIEDMYNSNSRTKVTLVVHSMGGLVSLHFLTGFRGISQAWKDKYIHAYITLSAAWSGGMTSLQAVISGVPDILGHLVLTVPIVRSFESLPWLFPKPSVFGNAVLVSTPSKNYTANDYKDLFSKIKNYENGYQFFQRVQGINLNYPAPNVPTYCWYGDKVPTPKKLTYKKNFNKYTVTNTIGWHPDIANENGDGTVNNVSLVVCRKWSSMPSGFKHKAYDGVDHMDIVRNPEVLKHIAHIVGVKKRHSKKVKAMKKIKNWLG